MRLIPAATMLMVGLSLARCTTIDLDSDKQECRIIVVMPPQNADEKASDFVANKWIPNARAALSNCDQIVDYKQSKEVFNFLGVDYFNSNKNVQLSDAQIAVLNEKTKATHLISLNYKVASADLSITPKLYSLKPRHLIKDSALSQKVVINLPRNNPLANSDSQGSLSKYSFLRLIPNATIIGASFTYLINDYVYKKNIREVKVHENNSIPRVISAFSMVNVIHPYRLALFDYGFTFNSSLDGMAIDNSYTYVPTTDSNGLVPAEFEYKVRLYGLSASMSGIFFIHTPVGLSSLGVGFGLAPYWYQTSDSSGFGVVPITRVDVSHTIFMSERFFMRFQVILNEMARTPISTPLYKLSGHSRVIFGIGYFFPESKSMIRKSL